MKQIHLPRIILSVILSSFCYWTYLAFNTRMEIVFDSVGYENLGRLLFTQGWDEYFRTGPNREPLYPLLIAMAMSIGQLTGIAYTKIMALLGVFILLITQILTYIILCKLNIRPWISAATLAYLGISPALNNSAFSLFSEIAAYPFILGFILASTAAWTAAKQNQFKKAFTYGALLGLLFALATMVKAILECIFPLFLILSLGLSLYIIKDKAHIRFLPWLLAALTALACFYIPIVSFKWQNKINNGNFTITNRGPWGLYGNAARRIEPLTHRRLLTALAHVPGEGICLSIFSVAECNFWSFYKSDELGSQKINELNQKLLSPQEVDKELLRLAAQKALHNPAQYALLTAIEGLKMFFWESTKVGFVSYPLWLEKTYNHTLLKNILRLALALMSIFAFFYLWLLIFKRNNPLLGTILIVTALYIGFSSLFAVLTRYALPIAPLYLILIAYSLQTILAENKK